MASSTTSRTRTPRIQFDSYGEPILHPSNDPGYNKEPKFGLLFDIDGVLGRGANVFPEAKEAMRLLCNPSGTELYIPVAFVTNGVGDQELKAEMLSSWFDLEIDPDQVIFAPSPLTVFKEYHNKMCLFIGQGDILETAHALGFTKAISLTDVKAAYPLLDMVDHMHRRRLSKVVHEPRSLDPIEAVILVGEPNHWESNLQLLIDLLMTNGKPDHKPSEVPNEHIPVIACNMDLVYMDRCELPRFGHGAFLSCLQELYRQFTGCPLKYTALLGKPSEITYRFAEHTLSMMSKRMGYQGPIERLYFFGDNPDVDILGANLYNNFLRRYRRYSGSERNESNEFHLQQRASVAQSRSLTQHAALLPQTARGIESILVQTGVYKPNEEARKRPSYCHRDFQGATDLSLPNYEVNNCLEGVQLVLDSEDFHPNSRRESIA